MFFQVRSCYAKFYSKTRVGISRSPNWGREFSDWTEDVVLRITLTGRKSLRKLLNYTKQEVYKYNI